MSLMPTVATLATKGTEVVRELPMSPYAFGGLAFGSLLLLLVVLWFFRNTAAKYETPVKVSNDDSHGSHGAHDPGAHH